METLAGRFLFDQRLFKRYSVKTALRVRIWKSGDSEQRGESINISQRGIFFVTNATIHKDEVIEILLKMPQEITGELPTEWRCTGLVVHVESVDSPQGKLGIGARFDCYEVSRKPDMALGTSRPLQSAWPKIEIDTLVETIG